MKHFIRHRWWMSIPDMKGPFFFFISILLIFQFTLAIQGEVTAEAASIQNQVDALLKPGEAILGGTLLVKYKDGQNPDAETVAKSFPSQVRLFGEDVVTAITKPKEDVALVDLNSKDSLRGALTEVLRNPDVEYAQPLYMYSQFYEPVSNPLYGNVDDSQWYLRDTPSGIHAPSGWDKIGELTNSVCGSNPACGGSQDIKVAVIDSGVNLNIDDLSADQFDISNSMRFFYNQNNSCQPNEFYVNLNINTVQNPIEINFCQQIGSFADDSSTGHGTAVTSVIAMEDNTVGGVGVAFNTKILPIALNGGAFTFNSFLVAESIDYAVERGANVINLSLGGAADDRFLREALQDAYDAGVTVVAASGNCGASTEFTCIGAGDNSVINPIIYPAAYETVISVGSVNYSATLSGVTRSSYSSYGEFLDIVAPVGQFSPSDPYGVVALNQVGSYSTYVGTSFAAPQVAGIAALGYSINPNLTPQQIYNAMINSTVDVGTAGFDFQHGYGLINTENFINFIHNNYITWSDWNINGGTVSQVTLTNFKGSTYQSIRGTDNGIYTRSSADGLTWSPWVYSGLTAGTITVEVIGERMVQAVRGTDNGVYTRSTVDGINYTPWILSGFTVDNIFMGVHNGRIYQTVRGSDNGIYTRSSSNGTSWSTWIFSGFTQYPANFQSFGDKMMQSVRGTDNGIYTRYSTDGLTWTAWLYSGKTQSPVTFGVIGPRLIQSVRGTDNGIYTRTTLNGISWSPWVNSGQTLDRVTILSNNGLIYQAVRGSDSGAYTRQSSDGISWSPWTLSGFTVSPITMAGFEDEVFQTMRGTDGFIYTRRADDGINFTLWERSIQSNIQPSMISTTTRLIHAIVNTSGIIYTRSTEQFVS